mmetsp:Transcript_103173/g.199922  ORF Transcript_103173/g.199922 Transcript_103173/m.199922 type:complete len:484 (-) Transcript_103173:95-1546(-)
MTSTGFKRGLKKTNKACLLLLCVCLHLCVWTALQVSKPLFAIAGATPALGTASKINSHHPGHWPVKDLPSKRSARVARRAGNVILGGIIDVTKMSAETTIIAQCLAAVALVVLGNILISNEEAEKKEEEEKKASEEADRMKKRGEVLARLEAGQITQDECEIALFGATKFTEEAEFDIWRDSLLRYLGYSNELGEALRPVFPAAYFASYCAAFAYVFADSVDKGGRADKKKRRNLAKSTFLMLDSECTGFLTTNDVRIAFEKLKTPVPESDLQEYFAKVAPENLIDLQSFMELFDKEDERLVQIVEALQKPSDDGGPLANPSLVAGADALIWQTIASVALPGFTINRFVTLSEIGCEAQAQAGSIVAEYFPTVLGLSMIPIICKPLDELADKGLDITLRPLLFATIDADRAGKVGYEDLAGKLKERDVGLNETALRQLFDDMDTDKNGFITVDDWANGGFEKYKRFIERTGERMDVNVPAGSL